MPRLGADLAAAIAESNEAPLASSDVLVTMPLRWASRMPRFTPSVQARSSALTMRFFMGGGSRRGICGATSKSRFLASLGMTGIFNRSAMIDRGHGSMRLYEWTDTYGTRGGGRT